MGVTMKHIEQWLALYPEATDIHLTEGGRVIVREYGGLNELEERAEKSFLICFSIPAFHRINEKCMKKKVHAILLFHRRKSVPPPSVPGGRKRLRGAPCAACA